VRALVLGGVAWCSLVYLDRLPDGRSETLFAERSHETVGSSGAGKAMNLSRLGFDVTLWAPVGDDEPGSKAREALRRWGVDLVSPIDPAGTERHINLMGPGGERVSILVAAGGDEAVVDFESLAGPAAVADLATVTIQNRCRRFLPWLRAMGKPIWVDIHDYDGEADHHRDFIEAADFLFMSSAAGRNWRGLIEGRVAAGAEVGVCTHGAEGAGGYTAAEGWVEVEAVPVSDVVDTNGAGDAFFSGFAAAWLDGGGLRESLGRGAECAAEAIRSPELAPAPETG